MLSLAVAHVSSGIPSDGAAPGFGLGLALPQYTHESRAAAEKSLKSLLDPQWSVGRKIVHAVVEGSPKVEIIRYARTQAIDSRLRRHRWCRPEPAKKPTPLTKR